MARSRTWRATTRSRRRQLRVETASTNASSGSGCVSASDPWVTPPSPFFGQGGAFHSAQRTSLTIRTPCWWYALRHHGNRRTVFMRVRIGVFALLLLCVAGFAQTGEVSLRSPDGQIVVTFRTLANATTNEETDSWLG